MAKEWFSEWFGSPYYPILYKNRNEDEAEGFMKWLVQNIGLADHAFVLDLACGRGRHSRFLHALGYAVEGWDISVESIAEAQTFAAPQLHFAVHDMRNPFPTKGFDAILNLFTSFGYFDNTNQNLLVLNHIYDALKPGGILVLDYFNTQWVINNLEPQTQKIIEGITFDIHKQWMNGFIIKDIFIKDNDNYFRFTEKVQAISLSQFHNMLSQAGFIVEAIKGDYAGSAFEENTSTRMIFIARKPTNS